MKAFVIIDTWEKTPFEWYSQEYNSLLRRIYSTVRNTPSRTLIVNNKNSSDNMTHPLIKDLSGVTETLEITVLGDDEDGKINQSNNDKVKKFLHEDVDTLYYCGTDTYACVISSLFGYYNMKEQGKDCYLLHDLTFEFKEHMNFDNMDYIYRQVYDNLNQYNIKFKWSYEI